MRQLAKKLCEVFLFIPLIMIQKKSFYLDKIKKLISTLSKQMLLASGSEVNSLLYWRTRILFSTLLSSTLIGLFILASVIPLAIENKLWKLLVFDGSAWIL